MSVFAEVDEALNNIIAIDGGDSISESGHCGRILFLEKQKPLQYIGGDSTEIETFKVIIGGNSYRELENKANEVKAALKGKGFIPIGGCEDIEPKEGETFMQLAVSFKKIINN